MEPTCFEEFQTVIMTVYGFGLLTIFGLLTWLLKGDVKLALLYLIGLRRHSQPTWFKVVIWLFLILSFVIAIALVQRCTT